MNKSKTELKQSKYNLTLIKHGIDRTIVNLPQVKCRVCCVKLKNPSGSRGVDTPHQIHGMIVVCGDCYHQFRPWRQGDCYFAKRCKGCKTEFYDYQPGKLFCGYKMMNIYFFGYWWCGVCILKNKHRSYRIAEYQLSKKMNTLNKYQVKNFDRLIAE